MEGARKSGVSLVVAGLLGVAFFWATDPRYGIVQTQAADVIDRIHDAAVATWVGIAGSVAVLVVGLWIMTRRVS